MFDHIGVVVSDFAKSKAFYTQALAPIGHSRVAEIMVDGGRTEIVGIQASSPLAPTARAYRGAR
jgi:catechol 2,3-dioxygenase-like lactoylglutathione lyase family enzyme